MEIPILLNYYMSLNWDEPGIRLGIIKRIKGLEFRAIALGCADPSDPMNDLSRADILDRCERYVAAARAREQLLVPLGTEGEVDWAILEAMN